MHVSNRIQFTASDDRSRGEILDRERSSLASKTKKEREKICVQLSKHLLLLLLLHLPEHSKQCLNQMLAQVRVQLIILILGGGGFRERRMCIIWGVKYGGHAYKTQKERTRSRGGRSGGLLKRFLHLFFALILTTEGQEEEDGSARGA